jgi:hypothetical protein
MMRALIVVLALAILEPFAIAVGPSGGRTVPQVAAVPRTAVYIVYYWRAKPGRLDAYNEYIRTVGEPIDEEARRTGAFEEVHTVLPAPGTSADWTHLRMFRLKNAAAAEALQPALDAAKLRVVPDAARRAANDARALTLRDLVRREVWNELP